MYPMIHICIHCACTSSQNPYHYTKLTSRIPQFNLQLNCTTLHHTSHITYHTPTSTRITSEPLRVARERSAPSSSRSRAHYLILLLSQAIIFSHHPTSFVHWFILLLKQSGDFEAQNETFVKNIFGILQDANFVISSTGKYDLFKRLSSMHLFSSYNHILFHFSLHSYYDLVCFHYHVSISLPIVFFLLIIFLNFFKFLFFPSPFTNK
jgi:hypothetical protein